MSAKAQAATESDGLIPAIKDAIASAVDAAIQKHMPPTRDELLPLDDVARIVGLKSTAIYDDDELRRMIVKIGRASRWPASRVYAWVEARKAESQL